jgi:1-phosphatidylinositol phosphodiesterase
MKAVANIFKALIISAPLTVSAADLDTGLADWMSLVDDTTPITDMTIPGTHDSGAMYEPFSGTAKTQDLGITEQLNIGVRYLDIRLRHYQDSLVVHHGSIYQHLNFDDVLIEATAFLAEHPTETIFMQVSEEYEAYNNTRTFEETFVTYETNEEYADFWWTHSYLPELGDVRGKIVLLRRFSGSFWTSGGISVTGWSDNDEFDLYDTRSTRIHIQDYYKVKSTTNNNKWGVIYENLTNASTDTTESLFINFTSGYRSIIGIPNIPSVADDINDRLVDYFDGVSGVSSGILVSDFTSETLTKAALESYLDHSF